MCPLIGHHFCFAGSTSCFFGYSVGCLAGAVCAVYSTGFVAAGADDFFAGSSASFGEEAGGETGFGASAGLGASAGFGALIGFSAAGFGASIGF